MKITLGEKAQASGRMGVRPLKPGAGGAAGVCQGQVTPAARPSLLSEPGGAPR